MLRTILFSVFILFSVLQDLKAQCLIYLERDTACQNSFFDTTQITLLGPSYSGADSLLFLFEGNIYPNLANIFLNDTGQTSLIVIAYKNGQQDCSDSIDFF